MTTREYLGLISVWLLCAIVGYCQQPGELVRFARREVRMGVEFEVVLYAAEASRAENAMAAAMARIAELDQALSDYDLDSELSRLSATSAPANAVKENFPAVRVSDDLWRVLAESQRLSVASGGAFDVTIGPLTKLWRRARRWKELPQEEALAAARAAIGYQHLRLEAADRTAHLLKSNMRLDLGGIAKGYAADEALAAIQQRGIGRALVRASGDIAAGDPPPGEEGWLVGIAPLEANERPRRFVRLANCAISTSGDAQQHLVVNGRRYSHILDPRSCQPVEGRSSVSVIAPRGVLADGLATAASVLGPEEALAVVMRFPGVELMMVHEDAGGQQRAVESAGFARYEVK